MNNNNKKIVPETANNEVGKPIYILEEDYRRLRLLAASAPKTSEHGPTLRSELERAEVVAPELLPAGVVTMNARVRFEDIETGETEEYILTWPDRADPAAKRISILSPIGTALLGYREGDEVSWPTPGGTRRLKIVQVEPAEELPPPEEAGAEAVLSRLLYGRS